MFISNSLSVAVIIRFQLHSVTFSFYHSLSVTSVAFLCYHLLSVTFIRFHSPSVECIQWISIAFNRLQSAPCITTRSVCTPAVCAPFESVRVCVLLTECYPNLIAAIVTSSMVCRWFVDRLLNVCLTFTDHLPNVLPIVYRSFTERPPSTVWFSDSPSAA